MMTFKPIDPKRDEFRRYLERYAVVEAISKVLVRVMNEEPGDPMEYIKNNLGIYLAYADDVAYLQSELKMANGEIQRLKAAISERKLEQKN